MLIRVLRLEQKAILCLPEEQVPKVLIPSYIFEQNSLEYLVFTPVIAALPSSTQSSVKNSQPLFFPNFIKPPV